MSLTRMFLRALVGALLAVPSLALAQSPTELDAELFRPSTGQGLFAIESARLLQNLRFQGNAFVNFSDGALVALNNQGEVLLQPVQRRTVLDASFALGLFDFLELGVAFPVALAQAGDDLDLLGGGVGISGSSLGDIRLTGKARVVGAPARQEGFFLSFVPEVKLPTGDGAQFFGNQNAAVLLGAAAEWRSKRFLVAANAGPRFQQEAALQDLVIGNQIDFGGGASFAVNKTLSALAELEGAFSLVDQGENPLEARAGAKITLARGLSIPVGAGLGLSEDVGAPRFRVFAGASFAPGEKITDDDKDGIFSDVDKCPKVPEDADKFEDADGCPEEDNDKDSIADLSDDCPNDPGVASAQGCPDQDGDTVADADDDCVSTPGPVASQGCPDSDGDTIADNRDQCVSEPEDRDGVRDSDGCPEDNDDDKIADADDLCPNDPETYNGVKDEDGCPETFTPEPGPTEKPPVVASTEGRLLYQTNRAALTPEAKAELDRIAARMKAEPSLTITLEGHADDIGTAEENLELSRERARQARRYLVAQGVEKERVKVKGFGEKRPAAEGKSEEARSQNRRVEVVIESN